MKQHLIFGMDFRQWKQILQWLHHRLARPAKIISYHSHWRQMLYHTLNSHGTSTVLETCPYSYFYICYWYGEILLPMPKATQMSVKGWITSKSWNKPARITMTSVSTWTVFAPCSRACCIWTIIRVSASSWLLLLMVLLEPKEDTACPRTVFLPSNCSCASGKRWRKWFFNLVLLTCFLTPSSWSQLTYEEWSSDSFKSV